jgi:hypothetical protein
MIAASNGWILAFDNVSHLPSWLSDALCRMATGGGFSTRELYSDGDEIIFDAERPVILTAIEEVITRADLLDRAVLAPLPTIAESRRRAEAAFWSEFQTAAPAMLGGLLDVLVATMREFPTVAMDQLPRMADFALWSTAAEDALGLPKHIFMNVYTKNRTTAHETAVEASPIGPAIRAVADADGWTGTATGLLERLTRDVPQSARRAKDWPGSGRALAGAIRRLAAPLRGLGVEVAFTRMSGGSRDRLILIKQNSQASNRPDRPDGPIPAPGGFPDGDDGRDNRDDGHADDPDVSPQEDEQWNDGDGRDDESPARSGRLIEVPARSYLRQSMPTEGIVP